MNFLQIVNDKMVEAHQAELRRGYLGMSVIGTADERTLWLNFRWLLPDEVDGERKRIFDMGHLIEAEVVRIMRLAGFEVYDKDESGNQIEFSDIAGHFSGHCDGAIRHQAHNMAWHVLEIKSAKEDKFKELVKLVATCADHSTALGKWEPAYYGQVQCYMHHTKLKAALFIVYCKDNSEMLFMTIHADRLYYQMAKSKADRIIFDREPPQSSYPSRSWFEIARYKGEEYQAIYWGDRLPERVHCRNCRHAHPLEEGSNAPWYCARHRKKLTVAEQHKGCSRHNWLTSLVPLQVVEFHDDYDAVEYEINGVRLFNASEPDNASNAYSSKEFVELSKVGFDTALLTDGFIQDLKQDFNARLDHAEVTAEK